MAQRHRTQDAGRTTQDARRKVHDAGRTTQGAGRRTQDTRRRTHGLKDSSESNYSEYLDLMRLASIPEMPLHSFVKNSISSLFI